MQTIEIEFCNPNNHEEIFTLSWKLLEHEAALVWFGLCLESLRSKNDYFFRFTGFVGGIKDEAYLLASLQKCIDVINADGRYRIKEKADKFSQEFSNAIHHHFEILSGEFENPTEFLNESSDEVLEAVSGLNYNIHDLEAYTRNLESDNSFAGVILEIKNCSRYKIPESFNKFFTMNIEFGDMVLHYSQIGKTWLEAFLDKDEDIFPEAIRPHYALSGEFDIMFGNLDMNDMFLNALKDFLKIKGKDFNDDSLKLGHLTVAKFIRNSQLSDKYYKNQLAIHSEIKKITLMNSQDFLCSKTFPSTIHRA